MAITRMTESEDPHTGAIGISDYEKLRLEKIKRNEDRMKELGLFRTKDTLAAIMKKKKANTNKIAQISPELPQRRSSRKRKTVVDYSDEQMIHMYEDDEKKAKEEDLDSGNESTYNDDQVEEGDYEASENEDDDEDDDEEEKKPPKKRSRSTNSRNVPSSHETASSRSGKKKTTIGNSFVCVNPNGGLTFEYAKTGRSSCRKCRNKIEKGKPRVGMEAWIVGRNCITWQRPSCLLQNLCCVYERSNGGKGKCKASHIPFAKGQLKVGIRCHTATSYYRIEAIAGVLSNVVSLMRTEDGHEEFELKVDGIDGNEILSSEDRKMLESILEAVFQNKEERREIPVPKETNSEPAPGQSSKAKSENDVQQMHSRDQPNAGTKTGAKGRVEWKFGGRTCYGTLIQKMETKTHCYARTHKGNVKTLAKGKDYWSMVE